MDLTSEQRTIVDFVRKGNQSLVVEALPGTGKTSTLLAALPGSAQKSILVCAFNRRIVNEIKDKLPSLPRGTVVHVKTLHELGWGTLRAYYPQLSVNKDCTEALFAGTSVPFKRRWTAIKLLRAFKETLAVGVVAPDMYSRTFDSDQTPPEKRIPPSPMVPGLRTTNPTSSNLLGLGWELDIFNLKMKDREIELVIEAVREAYVKSMDFTARTEIDYCDMVWAPLILDLKPKSRYQAIYVDELQDISEPQFALLRTMMLPTSRFVGIGDQHQQIYSWRGSMGQRIWDACKGPKDYGGFGAATLPLTLNFRCALPIIAEAQQIVPALRGLPDNDGGSVTSADLYRLPHLLAQGPSEHTHTFVLSRTNRDLLDVALFLWREDVRFTLNAGKDMLAPVLDLLDALLAKTPTGPQWAQTDKIAIPGRRGATHIVDRRQPFKIVLDRWRDDELAKAEKANTAAYAERVREYHGMLDRALEYVVSPASIRELLTAIIDREGTGVLLSTVHKVKGLEADRVFLLAQTFTGRTRLREALGEPRTDDYCAVCGESPQSASHGPFADAHTYQDPRGVNYIHTDEVAQEELNIELVAITRAREHLVWVDIRNRAKSTELRTAEAAAWSVDYDRRDKLETAKLHRLYDFAEREVSHLGAKPDVASQGLAGEYGKRANVLLDLIRQREARKG